MYIGKVKIDGKVALAPMAGVADRAFRILCKELGAALVYSEMASAKGLVMESERTKDIMLVTNIERPMAIQLFGDNPEVLKKAAIIAQNRFNPDILDLNFGCPAPKIAGNGDGAALMREPEKAASILEAIKSVSSVPVTVKFRRGWDDEHINAVDFGLLMEQSGADALTIHGRTKAQQYHGEATYDEIKELKSKVKIPVIANGDITSGKKAKEVLDYTGADMVMVGRGAYGNPFIFAQINDYLLSKKELEEPSIYEKMAFMLVHIEKLVEFKGEEIGMKHARKHIGWYTKGLKNSSEYRMKLSKVFTYSDIEIMVDDILEKHQAYKEIK